MYEFIPQNLVRGNAVTSFAVMLLSLSSYFYGGTLVFLMLLILQVINFGLGSLGRKSLLQGLGRVFAKLFNSEEMEHLKAVKFANQIGFFLLSVALFFSLLGLEIGLIFLAVCIGASFLNAFAGFCVACWLYPRLLRVRKQ